MSLSNERRWQTTRRFGPIQLQEPLPQQLSLLHLQAMHPRHLRAEAGHGSVVHPRHHRRQHRGRRVHRRLRVRTASVDRGLQLRRGIRAASVHLWHTVCLRHRDRRGLGHRRAGVHLGGRALPARLRPTAQQPARAAAASPAPASAVVAASAPSRSTIFAGALSARRAPLSSGTTGSATQATSATATATPSAKSATAAAQPPTAASF